MALLYPMIVLATRGDRDRLAGGDFRRVLDDASRRCRSVIRRACAVVHTSREMSGRSIVPPVNYFLLLMVLLAVLGFRSRTAWLRPMASR